jgi:hypothetical protein
VKEHNVPLCEFYVSSLATAKFNIVSELGDLHAIAWHMAWISCNLMSKIDPDSGSDYLIERLHLRKIISLPVKGIING